jgi:hypothetical protein
MLKTLTISLLGFVSLFVNYLYTNEVSLFAKYPAEVAAGESFQVDVTVEKGNLSDFGRFAQELPQGFVAESQERGFSFAQGQVRMLWIAMPAGNSFSFSYIVRVPVNYSGELDLGGQFSYVMNNERKTSELAQYTINIKPAGTPDADINRQQVVAGKETDSNKQQITAQRQMQEIGQHFVAKITINKQNQTGMAKIVENIPAGYTAEAIETTGGIFTQEGQTIKFLWMNMPENGVYSISYRLSKQFQANKQKPHIEGNFSFTDGGVTRTVPIIENDIAPQLNNQEKALANKLVNMPAREAAAGNVTYNVQIAAGQKLVDARTHFRKFNINEKVTVIQHEGWHKYTIGRFADYKSARDYRVKIWGDTPVNDAFVAAYNGNQRITVQEALMIANQQWIQ